MKAAVYGVDSSIGIVEPDPGWVPIGVTVGGICGSDLHIMHRALGASNCYSRESEVGDFALGAKLAAEHATLIEPFVTHTFALDEVAKAFATADDKSNRSIKVQIHN